jgi:hypothetical protein
MPMQQLHNDGVSQTYQVNQDFYPLSMGERKSTYADHNL